MAYVYIYLEEGVPKYVGKGNGDRDKSHLKTCKNKRFRAWLLSSNPVISRVAENLTEDEAYLLESELIAKYGRMGYEPNGTLLNHSLGGRGGTYAAKLSKETCLKMSTAGKLRIETIPDFIANLTRSSAEQWKDPLLREKRLTIARATAAKPEVQAKKSASMKAAGMRMDKHPNSKNYMVVTPDGAQYFFKSKPAIQQFFPHIPVTALGSSLHNQQPVKRGPAKGWSLYYHSETGCKSVYFEQPRAISYLQLRRESVPLKALSSAPLDCNRPVVFHGSVSPHPRRRIEWEENSQLPSNVTHNQSMKKGQRSSG